MRFKHLIVICLCVTVAGCAVGQAKSQKLVADAAPVTDVDLIVWMGSLPNDSFLTAEDRKTYHTTFREAMEKRLPQILRSNGIKVNGVFVDTRSFNALPTTKELVNNASSPYVLLMSVRGYTYSTRYGFKQSLVSVNYEADLLDVKQQKFVWKSQPVLGFVKTQPLIRTELLAGQVVNGLSHDKLVALKDAEAVDSTGDHIHIHMIFENDR